MSGEFAATWMNGHAPHPASYNLRLYVAGQSPKSVTALSNLRRVCDQYLSGRYTIDIIDLMKEPQRAQADQIVAIPTLIRKMPEPVKRILGDLSSMERVVVGLDLQEVG